MPARNKRKKKKVLIRILLITGNIVFERNGGIHEEGGCTESPAVRTKHLPNFKFFIIMG